MTIFDGMNEEATIIETLTGNYGTFGISSMGNSLFIKFETGNTGHGVWGGFFATIHYGTYNNIHQCSASTNGNSITSEDKHSMTQKHCHFVICKSLEKYNTTNIKL